MKRFIEYKFRIYILQLLIKVRAFEPIELDELKIHLGHHVHGATTEIIKITDFTENGYLPKCFLPFYTPPGQLPRKVQIDRYENIILLRSQLNS